jgi:hypothetical protein
MEFASAKALLNRYRPLREQRDIFSFYPPSQKTTGLPVDECAHVSYATARCRPQATADKGTTGLPVGLNALLPRREANGVYP